MINIVILLGRLYRVVKVLMNRLALYLVFLIAVGCASSQQRHGLVEPTETQQTIDEAAAQEASEAVSPEVLVNSTGPDESALPNAADEDAEVAETSEPDGAAGPVDAADSVSGPKIPDFIVESLSDEIAVSEKEEARIAKAQKDVYDLVKGTATKIDSFFGTSETDPQASVSRGRVSIGGQYDDRRGFEQRFRFKARIRLPMFKQRTRLLLGRGDADNIVDGSSNENIDTLPGRFQGIDEDEWLFGIGYSRDMKLKSGWSFGLGAKIRTPIEPYVKATYKWNRGFGEAWLLHVSPRIYWQEDRGYGTSIQARLDYAPYDNWLYRSFTILVSDDRYQGIHWTSKLFTYHSLSKKSAFSYGLYATGETEDEVQLHDYGLEIRHRRQVSRRHFYVEFLTYFSWPQELLEEEREFTPGIGIQFELQFGAWPGRSND